MISSGPYALIFGFLVTYILDIPSLPIYTVLSFPISFKTFAYTLLVQLVASSFPASAIAALCGFLAGLIVQTRRLPLRRARVPLSLFNAISAFFKFILPQTEATEAENRTRLPRTSSMRTQQPLITPNPEHVESLIFLGFSEAEARRALIRTNNDVTLASNYLLDERRHHE